MKEKIYTVPISEAFERPDEGCPLCFLRRNLEEASLRYILGDAMMEPSVRLETNARGFCARHLARMLERPARLSLALMLESLYAHLEETGGKNLPALEAGCYVCDRIALFMEHFRRIIVW
ncbi:MAG: DUF6062 family protein, partial [Oscillospiraceae bacterium]|nr:DUF6062 family protein [Oscillospiraceae bacterium]